MIACHSKQIAIIKMPIKGSCLPSALLNMHEINTVYSMSRIRIKNVYMQKKENLIQKNDFTKKKLYATEMYPDK